MHELQITLKIFNNIKCQLLGTHNHHSGHSNQDPRSKAIGHPFSKIKHLGLLNGSNHVLRSNSNLNRGSPTILTKEVHKEDNSNHLGTSNLSSSNSNGDDKNLSNLNKKQNNTQRTIPPLDKHATRVSRILMLNMVEY